MECKRYSKWIKDAALDSLDAARAAELRRHLLKCSLCAQQLEREQRLLAAVDQAMAQSLAVDTLDDLHVRVRQKIAEEAKAGFPFSLGYAVAIAAACAVVVAIVFVWLPHHPIARRQTMNAALARRAARPSPPVILSEAKNPAPRVGPSPLTRLAPLATLSPRERAEINKEPQSSPWGGSARRSRAGEGFHAVSHRHSMPEVLVPKNEMALVLSLYNGVRTGRIDGASLLATPPGFNRDPDGTLVAAPLKIEPIKISEIKPVSSPTELQ